MATKPPRSVNLLANLPLNILLYAVLIIPLAIMIYISFTDWNPAKGYDWWQAPLSGINNFVRMLGDVRLGAALGRTIVFVLVVVAVEFLLGLGMAYLLLAEFPGKRGIISLIIYPLMLPWVVVGLVFYLLFADFGPVVNVFLKAIMGETFTKTSLLLNPTIGFTVIMLADIWQWTPFMFLILYAGLSAVPKKFIEAAQVLGASSRTIFRRIQFPLIRPLAMVALVLRSLEAFKVFDTVYMITRGGPGSTTETISFYIYMLAVRYYDMAYASAVSLVLLIALAIVIRVFVKYAIERGGA